MNYEASNQTELDGILSKNKKELMYSTIELSPSTYKIGKIPYSHIRFIRSSSWHENAPQIIFDNLVAPSDIDFVEVNVIHGEATLSKRTRFLNCTLFKTIINKATLAECLVRKSIIHVYPQQEYFRIGEQSVEYQFKDKTDEEREEIAKMTRVTNIPFFQCCSFEDCTIDKANVYFDWAGRNIFQDTNIDEIRRVGDSSKHLVKENLFIMN